MQTFASAGLAAPVLRALETLGYTTPTPVQRQAIAPAMTGVDVLAVAQTGTGKTAAFLLPTIHRLLQATATTRPKGFNGPRALVLSPTRELAAQIADSFVEYAAETTLREALVVGGVSQRKQEQALARGVDLLVATPGRLQDLMNQRLVDLRLVETFVLDEADRMLDMGFIEPIRAIARALPSPRQTLMFSATMPRAIEDLARTLLREPVRIEVERRRETAALIEQVVYPVAKPLKPALLRHLLATRPVERAIVFTRTKHGADRLARHLRDAGFECDAIHGDRTQRQRDRALDGFRFGRHSILVATDVAARGIDVDGVSHVFNYDLPDDPESYVHRIGRTGRAGAKGFAIAFCDPAERKLLRAVEAEIGAKVPVAALPPRSGKAADQGVAPSMPPAPPTPPAPRASHSPSAPARTGTRPASAVAKPVGQLTKRRGKARKASPGASNQGRPGPGGAKGDPRPGRGAKRKGKHARGNPRVGKRSKTS